MTSARARARVALLAAGLAGAKMLAQGPAPPDTKQSAAQIAAQNAAESAIRAATQSKAQQKTDAELIAASRDAGLLTDWHMEGRYGRGLAGEMSKRFPPENRTKRRKPGRSYEMVFPEGGFALPEEMREQAGVFYASSNTYLHGGGDWIVYLESQAEAMVFVDGRLVISRNPNATGVQRKTIHAESGYHTVLVKFLGAAAPFRVAVLPPSSGSHRKNSHPYLRAVPASEEMMAGVQGCGSCGSFGCFGGCEERAER